MPTVRCPCGATYEVTEDRLGESLVCKACNGRFAAEAVEAPPQPAPSGPKPRLGELAVERGLISSEHVTLCVEYQEALRSSTGSTTKRLGEILIEKGLLKPAQVNALLNEQSGEAPKKRPAPRPTARLVPREPSEAVRASRPARRPLLLVGVPLLLVAGAAAVVLLIVSAFAPSSERSLVAYLRSSHESAVQADLSLVVQDLGLKVRDFRVEAVHPAARYDYAPDLKVFVSQHGADDWAEFSKAAEMSAEQRQALALVAPILPEALTPHQVGSLTITVQPATVQLFFKPRGGRYFTKGQYRFVMVRAETPRWSSGWRVADYEPLAPAPPK